MLRSGALLALLATLTLGCASLRPRSSSPTASPTAGETAIRVDQLGYLPGAPKLALVELSASAGPRTFEVRRTRDNSVAFTGALGPAARDADWGQVLHAADFTPLTETGEYRVEVSGLGTSWRFAIGPDVYRRLEELLLAGIHGQRCGEAVDLEPLLGRAYRGYRHAVCHTRGRFHESSGRTGPRASFHGWHDAGDYGRYVVNSSLAMGMLLYTQDLYGRRLAHGSELLSEVRWNLDWVLSMQDADGGVWHKQTSRAFAPFVMPENDPDLSEVIGTGAPPYKSSCATADLAAVAALASRTEALADATFRAQALAAARAAWDWLEAHPSVPFQNPPGVRTGTYGDTDCSDERLWAAAELWRATGEPRYGHAFLAGYRAQLPSLADRQAPNTLSVAPFGLWSVALGASQHPLSPEMAEAARAVREATCRAASGLVARAGSQPNRTTLATDDYIWASNGLAANQTFTLLLAHHFSPDRRDVYVALENLHYFLGRNAFSLSWVTGAGEHSFRHPHHRPSEADGLEDPWPGLFSEGPNARREDPMMMARLAPDTPPARMYLDDAGSYASNEVSVDLNAALLFLLAGVVE